MFNLKLYRLLFSILLFVYLVSFSLHADPPYSRVDSLASDIQRLDNTVNELNIQHRLTSMEVEVRGIKVATEKSAEWQDKFQWALIVLLGEAVWRLYDQFKAKRG